MKLSKEKKYIITRDRAEYGRLGQYELTTIDGESHCFFMDDTLGYEYFPVESKIKKDTSKNIDALNKDNGWSKKIIGFQVYSGVSLKKIISAQSAIGKESGTAKEWNDAGYFETSDTSFVYIMGRG